MIEWETDPFLVLPSVLADANDIRRALAIGDGILPELPKGVISEQEDCVLAVALSNGWHASVSSTEATLSHPMQKIGADGVEREGKTREEVDKSVEALGQLGFLDVTVHPKRDDERYAMNWTIEIPHTYAMAKFVNNFDNGKYPDLILEREDDNCGDQECESCNS